MRTLLTLLEVAFLLCIVVGVGLWSVPAAFVLGGTFGVAACEWAAWGRSGPQAPVAAQNGPQGPRSVP